ncbi:hypothetical protein JHW43_004243 [Diplocarpon mali]|nr:hypothetical protein JHW43_004243 [Diplocarpon mali]
MTLHSGSNCSTSGALSLGTLQTSDCNQFHGYGCSVSSSSPLSYGDEFNAASGGVYATQWTSDYIRVWFFSRAVIPADVLSGNPDPSLWGLPDANFQGSCDIDANFKSHQIIFDTTFCGDWAGTVWSADDQCKGKAVTCVDYVAGQPQDFEDAFWSINSVKVFTLAEETAPAPTSTGALSSSNSTSSSIPNASPTSTEEASALSSAQNGPSSQFTSSAPIISTHIPQPPKPSLTLEPISDHTSDTLPPFPTTHKNTTRPHPPSVSGWKYMGCVSFPINGFPFFALALTDATMTIKFCASTCTGYRFLGTYGASCFCGTALEDRFLPGDFCSNPCPGNASESCGGQLTPMTKKHVDNWAGGKNLNKRAVHEGYLLTVYGNEASFDLAPASPAPSSAGAIESEPSEVHFAFTTGGIPTPSTSRSPVGTLTRVGVDFDPSATATDAISSVHLAPKIELVPATTASITPLASFNGIGRGGGVTNAVEGPNTTYTTVVTTTYTDLCGCKASTLQLFTVTSTLTLTHCGSNATPAPATPQIPMTTRAYGTLILTVPCAETRIHAPYQNSTQAMATDIALHANIVAPAHTHVAVHAVTVVPQAVPTTDPAVKVAANGMIVSNTGADVKTMGWDGVLLGGLGVVLGFLGWMV